MNQEPDRDGVRIPPPLIYVAGLVLGWLAGVFHPISFVAPGARLPAGLALIFAALLIARSAGRRMRHAKTDLTHRGPTTALMVEGPFRFTRNPLYVAMALLYAGVALLANWPWAMLLLPVVLLAIDRLVIAREEPYLERKFGEPYRQYKLRVRRWI